MIVLDKNRVVDNITKRAEDDIATGMIGGAGVLVKQNGETIFRGFFGTADGEKPLGENSIFRLASMTKPITAVAALRQMDKGLISLDDTLDKYIPEYAEMQIGSFVDGKLKIVGPAKTKITIKHLLTHSSGLGCGDVGGVYGRIFSPEIEYDLESATRAYGSRAIAFDPFSAQQYSARMGFDCLARVVEITSGMTFDKYLQKEIFEPLGMVETTFVPTEEQWDRVGPPHDRKDDRAIFLPLDREHLFGKLPLTYFCGGAGLVSTLSDYEKFADMLLAGGVAANGERILKEETVRLMRTPAVPESIMQDTQRWGLGVRVMVAPTHTGLPLNSYGWSGAYGTHYWVDPDNKIVAIYLKTSYYDGGAGCRTANNIEKDVYL